MNNLDLENLGNDELVDLLNVLEGIDDVLKEEENE